MVLNELTGKILGCAFDVHQTLGPGMLESAYKKALIIGLEEKSISVQVEVPVDINYRSRIITNAFKIDLLIESVVVVELKSISDFDKIHFKQLLTYLKAGNYPVGLLINFNVPHLKEGLRRIDNRNYIRRE